MANRITSLTRISLLLVGLAVSGVSAGAATAQTLITQSFDPLEVERADRRLGESTQGTRDCFSDFVREDFVREDFVGEDLVGGGFQS